MPRLSPVSLFHHQNYFTGFSRSAGKYEYGGVWYGRYQDPQYNGSFICTFSPAGFGERTGKDGGDVSLLTVVLPSAGWRISGKLLIPVPLPLLMPPA